MKKIVVVFCILICFVSITQAQFSQFHVGLGIPTGKFADGDETKDNPLDGGKGFAAKGFTVGYKLYFPLNIENFSGVFGIEALYNGLNSDMKEFIEEDATDVTFMKYLNFPATIGINYSFLIKDNVKMYGEAAIGANYSMLTKLSAEFEWNDYQYGVTEGVTYTFTPILGFTYALEGGFFINNKISIGLRYNNLGSYKFKYKEKTTEYSDYNDRRYSDTESGRFKKALPITTLSLCVGVLF